MSDLLKVSVLGDEGVGKSCSTILFVSNIFAEEYDPTIENNYRKQISVDDEVCVLDILDTGSQEEFTALRSPFRRNEDGYVFMYSVTSRKSFDSISSYYQRTLRMKDVDFVPMIIVGNKCDLEKGRQVSNEEGEELAKTLNCPFFETSAKQGIRVTDAFHQLVREIRNPRPSQNNTHLRK